MTEKSLTETLQELGKIMQEVSVEYEKNCDEYWNALSEEDKLKAFFSVCKRIHKGDIEDKGTYRYVLYEIFGFDYSAYAIGMDCGYMNIHNCIVNGMKDES